MKTNQFIMVLISMLFGSIGYAQPSNFPMPVMVHVDGGTFKMGNVKGVADEQPVHEVSLNSFYLGAYEVTFKDFKKFVDATGYLTDSEKTDSSRFKNGLPPRGEYNGSWRMSMTNVPVPASDSMKPVGNISWFDAVEYCKWLSKMTGKDFRLPTEAEWEYAAKGGSKSKGYVYVGSNNLNEVAWYRENSNMSTQDVGQKMPNELGIYDMAGNCREWCSDWYGEFYYKVSPPENPTGPQMGTHRILRGATYGTEGDRIRTSYRNNAFPYNSALDFGFRVAISAEPFVKPVPKPTEKPNILDDLDSKGFIDVYGINFDIGKSKVKAESYPIIEQISTYLKDHPQMKIMVEGHTDNTGKEASNQTLSEKRAESIKAEIVKRGIAADRLDTKGFGSSVPVADNKTAEGRTQNRRVTIKKL